MRKSLIVALMLVGGLVAGLVTTNQASAQSFYSSDSYRLKAADVHQGSIYVAGKTIDIDGVVNGDVYCAGQKIVVTGTVNGDVLCAGQTVRVTGTVNGDVRVAAQTVSIDGTVNGTFTAFAQDAAVSAQAKVAHDVNGAMASLLVQGSVGRDIAAAAQDLTISGSVAHDVNVQVETMQIASGASVGGGLQYMSPAIASIPAGTVKGSTNHVEPPDATEQSRTNQFFDAVFMAIAGILFACAIALLIPQLLESTTSISGRAFGLSMLAGFAVVLATPLAIIAILLSFVGMYIAWALLLAWLLALSVGPIFAIYWVGRMTAGRWTSNIIVRAISGALVIGVIGLVPGLGSLVWFLLLVLGCGLLVRVLVRNWRRPHYHADAAHKAHARAARG